MIYVTLCYVTLWVIAFSLGVALSALHVKFRASLWPMLGAPIGFLICAAILPHPWRNLVAAFAFLVGLLGTRPLWKRWVTPIRDHRQELIDEIRSRRTIVVVGDTSGRVIPNKREETRLN